MSLDKATVAKIAHLARLKISDEEQTHLVGELNNLLAWVEQLGEVDTAGVDPMTSVVHQTLRRRVDEITDGGYPTAVVANAPEAAEHFFVVPKVVE